MIRVVLVDDHAVVRTGLGQLLATAPDIEVVGDAADGHDAVAAVERLGPDVVLMDVSMPGCDGIAATRLISARWPEVRVVGLTSAAGFATVLAMLDAGAAGYLLKDADPGELIRGVRAAAVGQAPMSPLAASALLRERAAAPIPSAAMTPREREVLALLLTGLSNRRIATTLSISEATVKAHLTRIYRRLGVTNRTGALRRGQELVAREPMPV